MISKRKMQNKIFLDTTKYYMPAEFAPHHGTLMIWPVRPGSWPYGGKAAQKAFCQIMEILVQNEAVYLLADAAHIAEAKAAVPDGVQVLEIESDDAWSRDVGPTFVYTIDKATTASELPHAKGDSLQQCHSHNNATDYQQTLLSPNMPTLLGIDWAFNAWGGEIDGLYAHWDRDDLVASKFCKALSVPVVDAHPFVLEGGSIHTDGEGTILVTESCLLSAGRNPQMTRAEIEQTLCYYLGGEKVLWLPRGICNDETNEHVDNICAFTAPGEMVLAWTEDTSDPQYELSSACLSYLAKEKDAKGRTIKVHKLPIPAQPILVQPEDLQGYDFEEGEDVRTPYERLAASYVNFYIGNKSVLVPQFGDVNDALALEILSPLFPDREVIGIPARDILLGGGNIHCITQQIPIFSAIYR